MSKYILKDGKLYFTPKKVKKGEPKPDLIQYTPFNADNLEWDKMKEEIQLSLNTLIYNVTEKGQVTPVNLDTLASIYVKKMQKYARELLQQELNNAN